MSIFDSVIEKFGTELQEKAGEQLGALNKNLGAIATRLGIIDKRLAELDRLAVIEQRLSAVQSRLEALLQDRADNVIELRQLQTGEK